jgi:23S rRNA (uracil1939-C5)-methyltransferase
VTQRRRRPSSKSGPKTTRAPQPDPVPISEEITIDALAAGGDGVGRLADGRVVFARLCAPGDRIRIEALDTGASFVKADSSKVLVPSDDRVEPRCKVFGRCGGCSWQHIEYSVQTAAKRKILNDAIERIGKFSEHVDVEFIPSPEPYGYRGRTRVMVSNAGVGFRKWHGHEIEPIDECPVLAPALNRGLAEFAASHQALESAHADEQEWALSIDSSERVHRVALERSDEDPSDRDAPAKPTQTETSPGVELKVGAETIRVSPAGFSQGNPLLFDELYRLVEEGLGGAKRELLIELFAGAGFFTVGLSRLFERTIAVESDKRATEDLARNLEGVDGGRVQVRCERVENALNKLKAKRPNAVVLDPPRAGLARGAAEKVAALGAGRIAYLSCDPATLARDLKIICTDPKTSAPRYRIVRLVGIDLFPQTPHVEALAILERVA